MMYFSVFQQYVTVTHRALVFLFTLSHRYVPLIASNFYLRIAPNDAHEFNRKEYPIYDGSDASLHTSLKFNINDSDSCA